MKLSPNRPPTETDSEALFGPNDAELDPKSTEEEPYSDDFLDDFMQNDFSDGDDYGYVNSGSSSLDGDDDFDSFFRDAEGYSQSRRQRRTKSRRESFEFEPDDRSDWRAYNHRRPRR